MQEWNRWHKEDIFQSRSVVLERFKTLTYKSPLFDVHLGENNILEVEQQTTKMISVGYWIFLKPLMAGPHQVMSSGSCQSGKIRIGITYDLYVE